MRIIFKSHTALHFIAIGMLLLLPTYSIASPVELTVEHKTVGDTVQYTPNLATGGFASPSEKLRFSENTAKLQWRRDDQLTILASISDRQFTTLRDHFSFLKTELTIQLALQESRKERTGLWLTVSSNRTSELNKNSYTSIENQVIKSVTVQRPADLKVELGLNRAYQLTPSTTVTGLFSLGTTNTKHSGINGNLTNGACDYQFAFHDDGGIVNQTSACGNTSALNRIYPNDQSVQQDLGVSPANDFRNRAIYSRIGIGIKKNKANWTFSSQFYHQQYFRDKSNYSDTVSTGHSYNYNQVLSTEVSHRLTNKVTLSGRLEYQRHRYLDEVPVLYTSFTSDRFKDDAIFFSVSMTYRLMQ